MSLAESGTTLKSACNDQAALSELLLYSFHISYYSLHLIEYCDQFLISKSFFQL